MNSLIISNRIENMIYFIRGHKVMVDSDLSELYGIEVKQLKRQVNRNSDRFPADFMIKLTKSEYHSLRCHSGTLKRGHHSKYLPYVFTENGVAMLSSILNSKRAVQVNIQIMRTFTRLRELISTHKDLAHKLNEIERKVSKHDIEITAVFQAIKQLMEPPKKKKIKKIGFR